jgi:hypothetical protein
MVTTLSTRPSALLLVLVEGDHCARTSSDGGGALALDDDMYKKMDAILVVRGIGGLRDRYRAVGVGWSTVTICWSSPSFVERRRSRLGRIHRIPWMWRANRDGVR